MTSLKDLYDGKALSTDDVASARNAINSAIAELEGISYQTGPDHILLKWGTLKSWKLHSDLGKSLSGEYLDLGSSMSAALQHDTAEQKDLICQMIDECNGVIQNDWDGEYYTKEAAKQYVMEYNS